MDTQKILVTLGIIALVGLYGAYQVRIFRDRGDKGPEMTGPATVVSHRVKRGLAPTQGSHWDYMVTFSLADGETIELYTTLSDYQALTNGTSGQLTWQGKRFYGFEPNAR